MYSFISSKNLVWPVEQWHKYVLHPDVITSCVMVWVTSLAVESREDHLISLEANSLLLK